MNETPTASRAMRQGCQIKTRLIKLPQHPQNFARLIDCALAYVARGWFILPLTWPVFPGGEIGIAGRCSCGNPKCPSPAKHPLIQKGANAASCDAVVVTSWWSRWPEANIGIATGPSGLVVLDVDGALGRAQLVREIGKLPETLMAKTGRPDGYHLYYRRDSLFTSQRRASRCPRHVWVCGGAAIGDELLSTTAPARRWVVEKWVPAAEVTMLGGDGGLGKSTLALQLSLACVTGGNWLGLQVNPCNVLYVSAEDPLGEVHFRLEQLVTHSKVSKEQLKRFELIDVAGRDAAIALFNTKGQIELTPLFAEIENAAREHSAGCIIFDAVADFFGGNENERRGEGVRGSTTRTCNASSGSCDHDCASFG